MSIEFDRPTLVSSSNIFVYRNTGTGFPTKWTGVWAPPHKLLDYFSFKADGEWLHRSNMSYISSGKETKRKFKLERLQVDQTVSPQKDGTIKVIVSAKNKTSEKFDNTIGLEMGVDLRHQNEDIGPQQYASSVSPEKSVFESSSRSVELVSNADSVNGKSKVKFHNSSDSQRALIPPRLGWQRKLNPGEEHRATIEIDSNLPNNQNAHSLNYDLDGREGFELEMHKLIFSSRGVGIMAGIPWFQDYWARDSFWSVLSLIEIGYFRTACKILENFAERGLPTKIPDRKAWPREDTCPLFIIAVERLSENFDIPETVRNAEEKALSQLSIRNQLVQHRPSATWMDTVDRSTAVDIQGLWLEACKMLGKGPVDKLRKGLNSFVENGKITDTPENNVVTASSAVPLMFGQLPEKVGETLVSDLNDKLISPYGARTLSYRAENYDSSGYHTGSTWGISTWWLSEANMKYGNEEISESLIRSFADIKDAGARNTLPENVDSSSGKILGAQSQAWSIAAVLYMQYKHDLAMQRQ